MIKIENYEVVGLEHAIRGMRNPLNSWDRSDSTYKIKCYSDPELRLGENDLELMLKLSNNGPVHSKYKRMITVYMDITAPLYWWKEFDTYKVGTVANSCSTMHKITEKEFTVDDFSYEHLWNYSNTQIRTGASKHDIYLNNIELLNVIVHHLNEYRRMFLNSKDKQDWWQIIQLLPSSYNQKRTVMLNYEVLTGIYKWRKNHKLDEWVEFCKWIETLPYSELIVGGKENG